MGNLSETELRCLAFLQGGNNCTEQVGGAKKEYRCLKKIEWKFILMD